MAGEFIPPGLGDGVENNSREGSIFGIESDSHNFGFLDDIIVEENPG
ncbi:hypothetical protein ES703_93166 [subsurface metagenome]